MSWYHYWWTLDEQTIVSCTTRIGEPTQYWALDIWPVCYSSTDDHLDRFLFSCIGIRYDTHRGANEVYYNGISYRQFHVHMLVHRCHETIIP